MHVVLYNWIVLRQYSNIYITIPHPNNTMYAGDVKLMWKYTDLSMI